MPPMFVCVCPNATKTKHFGQDSLSHKKPELRRKNHVFTVSECGKGRNHDEKPRFGPESLKNIVRKGRKSTRFWTQNVHGFQVKNDANLTNGNHFTHIQIPPPPPVPHGISLALRVHKSLWAGAPESSQKSPPHQDVDNECIKLV